MSQKSGIAAFALVSALIAGSALLLSPGSANAAQGAVGLGTAGSFGVLAGSTVTNTGPTNVEGNLGVSPGTAITGFPPGQVTNGTTHAADAQAAQAQSDLTTAYNDAAGRGPSTTQSADLGGQTLMAGVYSNSSLALTGTLTLDAQGDPSAVFIFQSGSSVITASGSVVRLINGAAACNVFWQVSSSATLGTGSTMVGTVMALASITANTSAKVSGRLLARNGAVTLDSNIISAPACSTGSAPSPSPSPTVTAPASASPSPSIAASTSPTSSPVASPSVAPSQAPVIAVPTPSPAIPSPAAEPSPTSGTTPSTGSGLPLTGGNFLKILLAALAALALGGQLVLHGHLRGRRLH